MKHARLSEQPVPGPSIPRCLARGIVLSGALAVLWLLGCGGLPDHNGEEPGVAVVVMVAEAETNAPLQTAATVIVGGVRGVLQPEDEYLVLRDVPVGTGTPPTQPLTASARGYVTRTQQVEMRVTAATWVQVLLRPADRATTGTVEGTVRQAGAETPVTNAFLSFAHPDAVQNDDDDATDTVGGYTDSDGRFIIGGIPVGERRLTVQARGYLPFTDRVTIRADANDGNEPLHIELIGGDTTVDLRGVVVDVLTRLPLQGAVVTVAERPPVETGPNGRFTVAEVPVGEQTVTVAADGYEDFTSTITILPGMDRITIQMFERADDPPPGPYTIGGTVTLSGAPDNSGATVTAVLLPTGETMASDTTGPSGRYRLFVPPGRYDLTVRFGERSLSRDIIVPSGGVVIDDVDFVLTVG